jgi:HEAT repeat protein
MQNIVVRYCDPPLDLQYREFHIEDVLIGLVTVFPPPVLPVFTRNTGREDTDGVVWVRSGHGHPRRRRATANEIREFFLGYLRTLYPFLEDEEWERYENRVRRLLRIPDADRVAYLATELVQPHVDRRATACQALGEIGGLNDNAKRLAGQLLIGALYDEEPSVHWEAVRGLSRLGDERAIVPLHALSQEASQELAIEIVDAIRAIGGATAVTTLRAILDETIDDEVQVHVQVALAELTEQELEDTLLEGV